MSYEYYQLQRLIGAYDTIQQAGMSEAEARQLYRDAETFQEWINAERHYENKVRAWLSAEKKWEATQHTLSSEAYAAGKRGWLEVRKYVPNLDGAPSFEQLPVSLQFRYAAFASAVLGLETPSEVKSTKQVGQHWTIDGPNHFN